MTNPIIRIHDLSTDSIIDREMNSEEMAQWKAEQAVEAARQEDEAQKASDKAALLAKLGISAEEAALLLG